jgi:endonuclease/exonuclease/phosphatase family metal-dependent hydrolase
VKIIFLNTWYAKVGKAFFDFIRANSLETDAFCFQEVDPELYKKLVLLLPGHNGLYESYGKVGALGKVNGHAVFVGKTIKTISSGKISLYKQIYNDNGFLQYVQISLNGKDIHLANIHAKAHPGHKLDTPVRLRQSGKIINFFKDRNGIKIIGGDFNLLPETKSVEMFEDAGYRNLIKDFKIERTRNEITWKYHSKGKRNFVKQYYADYVFTSPDIKINSFEVPDVEISDHLPLILDFEI